LIGFAALAGLATSVLGQLQPVPLAQVMNLPVVDQAIGADGAQGLEAVTPKQPIQPLSTLLGVALPANMPTQELPLLDTTRYIEEDAQSSGALREGITRDLPGFDVAMGEWLAVPTGGWLWVMDVKLPGAFGVRPHLSDLNLPEGAQMVVYDPIVQDNLPDPYVNRGPLNTGEWWAWTSWSDTARIEVYYPPESGEAAFANNFVIDKVGHMYRNPATGGVTTFDDRELNCHQDVSCFSGWNDVRNCVGRMSFQIGSGFFACSGAMMNNTSTDFTPYFMTARHCLEDNSQAINSLEVYWFFQSSSCNGVPPAIGSVPRSVRSTYVLSTSQTDMSMVMIEGVVPRNLWWTGASLQSGLGGGTQVVGIHHPDGTFKRLSNGAVSGDSSCGATGLTQGSRVPWTGGTTEPGSSGSPLFLTNGAVVGVLSCGNGPPFTCSDRVAYYGRWGTYNNTWATFIQNPGSDDSNENNDICTTATNLNIYFNGTLYSQIVKVNDEDWFRVSVPGFGSCSFNAVFTNADGDIDMSLRDGCSGAFLGTSTSTGNSETITWNNPGATAREVYLRTYLFNDTRNIYYLNFSRSGPSAPANNACSNAQPITVGDQPQTFFGTTFGASTDGNATCGTSSASPDVWYRFTPSCTQTISINTAGSAYDTVISLHSGACGNVLQVACNDDVSPGTLWSNIQAQVIGGTSYYIRVAGYNGLFGSYQLNFDTVRPSNDNCANAIDLPEGSYAFNNCACTTDGPPDDVCLAFGSNQIFKDFWFAWTAPCSGLLDFNTFGSAFDTKIAVYANGDNSSCPSGPNSAIVCNDDINTQFESQVVFATVPGQRYILRIGSYAAGIGAPGIATFSFTPDSPPADSACSGATPITLDENNTWSNGWYTCAYPTAGFTEACIGADGQFYNDRWFTVSLPCDGTIDFNTLGSGVDTRIGLYVDCPTGPDTLIVCNDNIDENNNQSQLITSVVGNYPYLLRVGNWSEAASGGLFANVVFTLGPDCSPVVCDSIDFNNDGSLFDPTDIDAFLSVFAEGPCIPDDAVCNDIDFNNDGSLFDPCDIDSYLLVFAEGPCTLCGQ